MPAWTHDGLEFYYREAGQGLPFVFQHGLGGDSEQTFGLFVPPPGVRLLTLEAVSNCREHRHLPVGPRDPPHPFLGEREILYVVFPGGSHRSLFAVGNGLSLAAARNYVPARPYWSSSRTTSSRCGVETSRMVVSSSAVTRCTVPGR